MVRSGRVTLLAGLALSSVLTGCATLNGRSEPAPPPAGPVVVGPAVTPAAQSASPTMPPALPVSYQTPASSDLPGPSEDRPSSPRSPSPANAPLAPLPSGIPEPPADQAKPPYRPNDPGEPRDGPLTGQTELSVEQLVAEVQARNPSLQAASAAWRAAAERYPQVVSLEDPMFGFMVSPSGLGQDEGGGWMVEASQKVPWAGKRALRGSAARAEADAVRGDIGDTRLRLSEAARMAFYDYYLARREAEVNTSTHKLLTQFREIATNKYQVNQATEQDVLQADVELANLESRRTGLTRDESVAIARINTLLHRAPDCPLPPPPAQVVVPNALPTADELQQAAIHSRPDLFARQARIRAEEANLALACKDYYPDLDLKAKYDGFMPEEMRPQVGMEMNVPLCSARRSAAVREAANRIAQARAEYQDRLDQVRFEVQAARERTAQNQRVIRLYEEKILPATQRSLDSALANYTSGKLDFLRLIDAQRQVYTQRELYYQTIAAYYRRLAELERAVGQPIRPTP